MMGVKKVGQHKHTSAAVHWQLARHAPVSVLATRLLWVWGVQFGDAAQLAARNVDADSGGGD
jgi:hypothetical protein